MFEEDKGGLLGDGTLPQFIRAAHLIVIPMGDLVRRIDALFKNTSASCDDRQVKHAVGHQVQAVSADGDSSPKGSKAS